MLQKKSWRNTLALTYSAIGVVYGDVGTSPLYVFSSTFTENTPTETDVLGAMSIIFWTITLIVVFKYMLIVLLADDNGEGEPQLSATASKHAWTRIRLMIIMNVTTDLCIGMLAGQSGLTRTAAGPFGVATAVGMPYIGHVKIQACASSQQSATIGIHDLRSLRQSCKHGNVQHQAIPQDPSYLDHLRLHTCSRSLRSQHHVTMCTKVEPIKLSHC